MCDKCKELDKKIQHYRMIRNRALDDLIIAGISRLIEEAEAEKAALHPERKK
jgi:hypothetical protein